MRGAVILLSAAGFRYGYLKFFEISLYLWNLYVIRKRVNVNFTRRGIRSALTVRNGFDINRI